MTLCRHFQAGAESFNYSGIHESRGSLFLEDLESTWPFSDEFLEVVEEEMELHLCLCADPAGCSCCLLFGDERILQLAMSPFLINFEAIALLGVEDSRCEPGLGARSGFGEIPPGLQQHAIVF